VTNFSKVLEKMRELGLRYGDDEKTNVVVGIFFDVDCPACARMHRECSEYIMSLVREGKISLYYLDFPVHRGSENAHVILRRIYRNNPDAFLEVIRKVYLNPEDKSFVESLKNVEVPKEEVEIVMTCKKFGKELGVRGTPTMLIGMRSKNIALVIEGYWGRAATEKLIERALTEDKELEKLITLLILIGNVREYPPRTETGGEKTQTTQQASSMSGS